MPKIDRWGRNFHFRRAVGDQKSLFSIDGSSTPETRASIFDER
jgi:hypothetical protein